MLKCLSGYGGRLKRIRYRIILDYLFSLVLVCDWLCHEPLSALLCELTWKWSLMAVTVGASGDLIVALLDEWK